jgi:cellulose biosynthesis protein BcsQ
MRVAIYNNKGGVGKSTLVCHTAFRAAEQKKELLVVDADRQNNTMSWLSGHNWDGDESFEMGSVTVTTHDDERFTGITVIDAPPAFEFVKEIGKVDIWIIPVNGRFSVDGAINVISQIKRDSKNSRIILVANMADPNTKFGKQEIQQIRQLEVELFDMVIPRHDSVRKAESIGSAAWKVPYGIRSMTAQNLQYFSDWVLRGCNKKGVID